MLHLSKTVQNVPEIRLNISHFYNHAMATLSIVRYVFMQILLL